VTNVHIRYAVMSISLLVIILLVYLMKKKRKSRLIVVDDVIESYYYRYGGDIGWIRGQFLNYKFKSLSAMLSSKDAEDSDFRIDILEGEDGKKMNVYATEYSYNSSPKLEPLIRELQLTEQQYGRFLENILATYCVKGPDAIREQIRNKKKENKH
jgi:hypothetical protein